jgi:hypothetical protein
MFVTSWPLANGTLLLPRLLSNAADAPYLGETAILYHLTRLPAPGVTIRTSRSIPTFVLIVLGLQIGFGLLMLTAAIRSVRAWRRERDSL